MWVIAHTLEASDGKNLSFDQLKTTFEAQANSYTGITGPTALDANGDRDSGAFDYYGIVKTGTTYGWIVAGESN
jgi:branched-chain amino acid transport system substrate-binding protein